VFSKDGKSHISHLKYVFERCREFEISLNPTKSVFGVTEGKRLGHIISKDAVKIDPKRIEAIKQIPLLHQINLSNPSWAKSILFTDSFLIM
jgi:hypothetical protein